MGLVESGESNLDVHECFVRSLGPSKRGLELLRVSFPTSFVYLVTQTQLITDYFENRE